MSAPYKTRSGDAWDAIALRESGSENFMPDWLDANPAYRYTARFDAGVDLKRPTLPTPARAASLPPWRLP